ncbi:MAG TPA: 3-isopropylmalate dehydrogenase [Hellea balneolensis]|uniref:3-isopropylmalate dehydrogenase n=1 Tax=Hellea balneolensis TaxID=287478 RepID=A0A7C5QWY4_9PROT|nr:3-isopropylmalate dehydrogenase [Hellea balneolensis]
MNIHFTYLPGDGIGPEVGAAALNVLNACAHQFGHTLEIDDCLIGGAAIDDRGTPLPEETLASARETGAILLGAVGGPKWDNLKGNDRPELGGILALRKGLDLYANLRPAKPVDALKPLAPLKMEYLDGVDFLVLRELTGGLYFGAKGRDTHGAFDECAYTDTEIERITVRAFELARTRKHKVTSVDKSNVLETSRLWREIVIRVHENYQDVELEHLLIDAATMHILTRAKDFDVILTENMFGDILTDEASVLCGSMGVIPSASLGAGTMGLYEPIHGSAPDIAGQGRANPIAMILSAAWMLRTSFSLPKEADAIETAVNAAIAANALTPDLGGQLSTNQVGEQVSRFLLGQG